MKRFKVFKIIYYGFMVVIGIILCLMLPSINQTNALVGAMNDCLEEDKIAQLTEFFAPFYNENAVLVHKDEEKNKSVYMFEATGYDRFNTSPAVSTAQNMLVGYLVGVSDFDFNVEPNADGESIYQYKVEFSDGINKYSKPFENEWIYFIEKSDFIYFDITEEEYENSDLTGSIKQVTFYDAEGKEYLSTDNKFNLTFDTEYFTNVGNSYVELYNRIYLDRKLILDGTKGAITYNESSDGNYTYFTKGAKISYQSVGYGEISIKIKDVEYTGTSAVPAAPFSVTNGTFVENSAYTFTLSTEGATTFTFTKDACVEYVKLTYGTLEVMYEFNGAGNVDEKYSFTNKDSLSKEGFLGVDFDGNKQQLDYEGKNSKGETQETYWLKTFKSYKEQGYNVSNPSDRIGNVTGKTILQMVLYFVIMMIIGDFLVGKHYIVYFIGKLFGKKGAKRDKDEQQIDNKYEVNVDFEINVPAGYDKDVYIKYQKDEENVIEVTLTKALEYKFTARYQNGQYNLVSVEAEGLHVMKPQKTITVRGFRYKLEINLAGDNGVKPEIKNKENE